MEKNTISINKKVLESAKILEVKGDIIVPDSKPDIVNIINTNSNPYIYKEECMDGKYKFDGNIDTKILYLSDNGEAKCISTTLDFMDIIENSSIKNGMSTKYRIEILGLESKILNERKISIKAKLKIIVQFFENQEVEYIDKIDESQNVQKLQENIVINTLIGQNTIKSSLKEDISIDDMEDVVDILKTSISLQNYENKISYNKVLSKADVNIRILYITENSKISMVKTTIPIMNFIDVEKVTDEDICNMDYKIRNINIKPNAKEMKSINCQIDFEITCEVCNKKNIEIIQDMYGIDTNITFSQKAVEIQTEESDECEKISINENVLVEDIRSIFDVDARANIVNNTNKNCEGELNLDIYYETGNKLAVKNVKIPFMAKVNENYDNIEVKIENQHFKLVNEEVNYTAELKLCSYSNNYKKINLITDIQEEPYTDESDYAMIVYFVKSGDTIWNIARDFRVTTESIKKVNNLEENDRINVGEKLYIMK